MREVTLQTWASNEIYRKNEDSEGNTLIQGQVARQRRWSVH